MCQKSSKSVNFWQSYLKIKGGRFFWDTVYKESKAVLGSLGRARKLHDVDASEYLYCLIKICTFDYIACAKF